MNLKFTGKQLAILHVENHLSLLSVYQNSEITNTLLPGRLRPRLFTYTKTRTEPLKLEPQSNGVLVAQLWRIEQLNQEDFLIEKDTIIKASEKGILF